MKKIKSLLVSKISEINGRFKELINNLKYLFTVFLIIGTISFICVEFIQFIYQAKYKRYLKNELSFVCNKYLDFYFDQHYQYGMTSIERAKFDDENHIKEMSIKTTGKLYFVNYAPQDVYCSAYLDYSIIDNKIREYANKKNIALDELRNLIEEKNGFIIKLSIITPIYMPKNYVYKKYPNMIDVKLNSFLETFDPLKMVYSNKPRLSLDLLLTRKNHDL